MFNPLNAELNPICHLLALLGAHHIFHVSRIRVNVLRDLPFSLNKPLKSAIDKYIRISKNKVENV